MARGEPNRSEWSVQARRAWLPSFGLRFKLLMTITLVNVSDTAHTFTVTGQGIDIETMPGKTAKVTIDLPPGTYPFVCRFHESMGMKGTLVVSP